MKINIPKHANFIIHTLQEHGYEAYVVGGCVRDSLLGQKPKDWDITTSASPYEVKELFAHTIDTGLQHGTVTIMMDKEPYEVTTYRMDGDYVDHRRPTEVIFTKSLAEDVLRRDFTINAMAYNDEAGLVDLHHGKEDLEQGIIRCVGVARDRFDEDALRILRALRFAARFDFAIEEETKKAMVEKKAFLKDISAERIREEFTKMITSDHPEIILTAYEMGITKIILPEWDAMMATTQNHPHHMYNVGIHSLTAMQHVANTPVLRYTMLLHDSGKPATKTSDENGIDHFYQHPVISGDITRTVMNRFKFDNATKNQVITLVKWHDWRFMTMDEINKRSIRRLANKIGVENTRLLFQVQKADILSQSMHQRMDKLEILAKTMELFEEIVADMDCLTIKDLAINGGDLIKLGIKPGKHMGEILDMLLYLVLDDPKLNDKALLVQMVTEMEHLS